MTADPHPAIVDRLAAAGCVAAEEEAVLLLAAAARDDVDLGALLERRCAGEPFAWVTGRADFCGIDVLVDHGVYVPRWHSEAMADRAAERLPAAGRAIDLGTGSGAIAVVMRTRRPAAHVVGVDLDPVAIACARRNGVDARVGDLFSVLPADWRGSLDVAAGVLPYVPTRELEFLARDAREHEPPVALDGGPDGLGIVERAVREAAAWLRPGGALLLEVGGDQPAALTRLVEASGFRDTRVIHDDEGDPRGVEATLRLAE